jgi:hypothetical protein
MWTVGCASTRGGSVDQNTSGRRPAQYVAAGVVYLLLSAVLFLLWMSVTDVVLLFLALSTVVAGLVDLAVGWPRVHRGPTTRRRIR